MRLIDADALIKMMEEKCNHDAVLDELVLRVCRGGINLMPTIEVPQWIPCSERLPDKEGKYLVTDIKTIDIDIFTHSGNGTPMWFLSDNVTAWMPMPKPYHGEGEQDGNQ